MNRHPGPELRGIRITRRILITAAGGAAVGRFATAVRADSTPLPIASPTTLLEAAANYQFDVRLNTETRVIDGTATIAWRNATGRPQNTLYLRCYPNAPYYNDGEMTVSTVRVDDRPAQTSSPADDPTVLAIPLGRTVPPNDHITIDLAFRTTVPLEASGSFGIFGIDQERGAWSLADWYPILAGWEPEREAWYLDAPTPFGDPTFPETATYDLTLETASGLTLAHTGTLVTQQSRGATTTWRVTTNPVREFAMMLLPNTSDADGILERHPTQPPAASPMVATAMPAEHSDPSVSFLCYADEAIPDLIDVVVDTATALLPHYAALLGQLDETGITIASAHLAGANGVSWPGLICLDLTVLVRDGALGEEERPGLRFTVAHEIGHQWVGGILGLNSNDHGFMLEGFTNALAVGAIREAWGAEAAIEAMGRFVAGPYSGLVRDGRDERADQPLTSETNTVLRSLAVYGKAGLGFEAIRQAMGNDAWRSALSAFAMAFRNHIFTPDDLRTALTDAASDPAAIATLWTFWFEQTETTLPDIDPIVQGAGH